jgi:chaperonin GroES
MNIKDFKPSFRNVLVKLLDEEKVTKGGILLPDTHRDPMRLGEVIAIGPGDFDQTGTWRTPEAQVGQTVLLGQFSGNDLFTQEKNKYLLVRDDDILGSFNC